MSLTNSPFWFSSGATSAGGGGTVVYPYSIDQSLRFNDDDNAFLNRTPGSSGNRQTWTVSFWVKFTDIGNSDYLFSTAGGGDETWLRTNTNGTLQFQTQGGSNTNKTTSAVFRDSSSWYHIVVKFDSTQATAENRQILYVNGVQQTWTGSNANLNESTTWNHTNGHKIGERNSTGSGEFGGYLAEFHNIDGTALDATSFGETINGVWVPKAYDTADGVYGTNGFYLPFDDSAAIGDDESGNTNDWTANNLAASDVVPDSPTNNFATLNPLFNSVSQAVLSEGNLKAATAGFSSSAYGYGATSTFAIPKDKKIYIEVECTDAAGDSWFAGFATKTSIETGVANNTGSNGSINVYNRSVKLNGTEIDYGASAGLGGLGVAKLAAGDILGCMCDGATGKVWFSRNGTYFKTPTTDDSGTTGDPDNDSHEIGTLTNGTTEDIFFVLGGNTTADDIFVNFGQDSTNVASAESDANGLGTFEYAPPTDYVCLAASSLSEPAIGPQLASGEQSDDYFEPILYTGNGAGQHIGSGGAQHPIDVTTVANSIRFNDDDSAYLSRTPASAGNRKTFTLSTWIKLNPAATNYPPIFNAGTSAPDTVIRLDNTGKFSVVIENGGGSNSSLITNRTLKSSSKWYHILVAVDTTNATADDRIKIYIDGVEETSFSSRTNPSLNFDTNINNTVVHKIGAQRYASYWDGYMAEMYFIDGTALDPTSFGQYGSNGYWIPKAVSGLTFGTNGFYLDFSDNSTANALGTDSSGNGNDFSATNVATTDQMGDSPTQNFATYDANQTNNVTLSEGNLKTFSTQTAAISNTTLSFGLSSGKWYFEFSNRTGDNVGYPIITIADDKDYNYTNTSYDGWGINANGGYIIDGTNVARVASLALGSSTDIRMFAIDFDTGKMWAGKNGTWYDKAGTSYTNSTGPESGSNAIVDGFSLGLAKIFVGHNDGNCSITLNAGADDSFSGVQTPSSGAQAADSNGYGSFYYTPPTGFLALVDDNIPQEGIAGPDFTWIKERNGTANHYLFDTVRGATKNLHSNATTAEATDVNSLTSFDYQGFTIGSDAEINTTSNTYVAWNWKAGGKANTFNIDGTGYASIAASPISDGTIPLTGLSANTTSGFSIVSWTGNTTNPSTIAHGLSSAPEMIILKNRDSTGDWYIGHDGIDWTDRLKFTTAATASSSTLWNDTAPTSSVFTISSALNFNGDATIAYCFHSVDGFSKFGSYEGNSSATDGTFVYTGFSPAFVMGKVVTQTGRWWMYDSARSPQMNYSIGTGARLQANSSGAESSDNNVNAIQFLSNGFKVNTSNAEWNGSGQSYIYLAFAEAPFKYANAR